MHTKTKAIVAAIFILVGAVVFMNQIEKSKIDRSKLPQKVEENNGFQRWITNLKNKEMEIEADEFRLREESEIYNTRWMTVYSVDQEGKEDEYNNIIAEHQNIDKVIFSPSERLFIDYRNIKRNGYKPNEVRYYGLSDDKIIDARALECETEENCYFDRGYFLNNDVFVVTEFSLADDENKKCSLDESCRYTVKLHLVDLINNQRLVYESEEKELILIEFKPNL